MKPNELMTGDWVQTTFMGNKVPCKVVGISTDITIEYQNRARKYEALKEVEPIPLTEEILESNGFVQVDKHEYSVMDSYYNYLKVRCYADTYFEIGNAFDEEGELQAFADIQYVHELQHALRLCGIEKDIQL